jgi:hypothetical protein
VAGFAWSEAQDDTMLAQRVRVSIFERDVVGDISVNKQYSVGSHYSTFEMGMKGTDKN